VASDQPRATCGGAWECGSEAAGRNQSVTPRLSKRSAEAHSWPPRSRASLRADRAGADGDTPSAPRNRPRARRRCGSDREVDASARPETLHSFDRLTQAANTMIETIDVVHLVLNLLVARANAERQCRR
jgi:hypothetical protein